MATHVGFGVITVKMLVEAASTCFVSVLVIVLGFYSAETSLATTLPYQCYGAWLCWQRFLVIQELVLKYPLELLHGNQEGQGGLPSTQ